MPKITKRLVEAAEVREKDYIICDDELRGFAVRVLPSGKRYYIVQYRIGTRYRRMSLGQHGVLTTEKARTKAFGLLAAVKDGEDPAGDRQAAPQGAHGRRACPALRQGAHRGPPQAWHRAGVPPEPPPLHPAGDR